MGLMQVECLGGKQCLCWWFFTLYLDKIRLEKNKRLINLSCFMSSITTRTRQNYCLYSQWSWSWIWEYGLWRILCFEGIFHDFFAPLTPRQNEVESFVGDGSSNVTCQGPYSIFWAKALNTACHIIMASFCVQVLLWRTMSFGMEERPISRIFMF